MLSSNLFFGSRSTHMNPYVVNGRFFVVNGKSYSGIIIIAVKITISLSCSSWIVP